LLCVWWAWPQSQEVPPEKGQEGWSEASKCVVVSEAGGSGYEPKILLACQSTDWWLNTGANIHVCSTLNLFSSY
jgi:hypothetical protein